MTWLTMAKGCYFTKDGEKIVMNSEGIKDHFNAAKSAASNVVSAGPYNLVSYNASTGQATLEINPSMLATSKARSLPSRPWSSARPRRAPGLTP